MFAVLLVLASTILATPLENTHQYTVYNKCPTAIDLYIGGVKHGTIPKNGNTVKTFSTPQGYFYTDANGGSRNGKHTIHAGFYDVSGIRCVVDSDVDDFLQDYYYMISDPKHANTGLNVKPKGRSPYVSSAMNCFRSSV
jgi:hypothetical protein